MKISEMNWQQVEAYLQQRRPRRSCRSAAPSSTRSCRLSVDFDPVREGRRWKRPSRSACRCFRSLAYGLTPYFLAYPGIDQPAHRDLCPASCATSSTACSAQGFRRILIVNGHGGNQPAGSAGDRVDGRQSGHRRQVPQLVERAADLRQGAGDRPGRLACVLDGEFSLDAAAGRRAADAAEADDRPCPHAADGSRRRCAPISATAISAATTSGPTRTCRRSGTSPSQRRARSSKDRGHERTDPDLGRRRDRRHARRGLHPGRPEVVFVDSAAEHVAAINASGLRIDGPIFQDTVQAPAVPAGRPRGHASSGSSSA